MRFISCLMFMALGLVSGAVAAQGEAKFKRVFLVVFENADYDEALAQPFFKSLGARGALLAGFTAERHPSQANYIALTSGDTHGVFGDYDVNLNVAHVGDLLEAKGLSWKLYAEDYPGGCFQGSTGKYARKHVPFISYVNVQQDPQRCARLVDQVAFAADLKADALPEYSFYVPNLDHDGHDTGAAYADKWFGEKFGPLLEDPHLMKDTLVIVTFDESENYFGNHIYTALVGASVKPGVVSAKAYNHYSLLRLIEDQLALGNLGEEDAEASLIDDVWK